MLAGHYSAAFLAKTAAPRTPLWLLALAVQLVDVLWAGFVLLGVERLRLDPSLPSNPLVLEYMPYTHSLVGTLLWAGIAGFAVRRWLGSTAAAWAVAAAVAKPKAQKAAVKKKKAKPASAKRPAVTKALAKKAAAKKSSKRK